MSEPNNPTAVTAPLIEKMMALRYCEAPSVVALIIKQCVLDWLGVSIAAANEPPVRALREQLQEQGGHQQATVFGSSTRMSTEQAALLNGTISHMLDYDDVNFAILGHPTAPVLPAVLALGEHLGLTGAAIMDAFFTGYETSCRVGLLVAPGHYTRGFHATGTIGSFGSTMASARLLGLDHATTAHALGIAATRTSGIKAMFGTSCKPLHGGLAAMTGLFASSLAKRGFDSRDNAIECAQGFAATHSPDFNVKNALIDPDGGYHLYNNLFKFHAACYEVQATIECGRELRKAPNFSIEAISSVRIRANVHCNEICNIFEPKTGVETKFSLRASAALALTGLDTSRPDVYSDANARCPHLTSVRDKVSVDLTPDLALTESEMEITLADGRMLHARYDSGIPISDRTLQGDRVSKKFHSLVAPILGAERSERIAAQVSRLDELSRIDELMGLCN